MYRILLIFALILVILGGLIVFLISKQIFSKPEAKSIKSAKKFVSEIPKLEKLKNITIKVLVDNNSNPTIPLRSPWGVSMYVETEELSILFDSGPDPEALKENSKKLNVDLSKIDFIVISHEHGDHTGGLSYVAQLKKNLPIYIPKHMDVSSKQWVRELGFNLEEIETTTIIAKGIAIIGELYGPPYEHALAIDSKEGLIVLVGCSHPGVENLVAKAVNDLKIKPYLVIGGFHSPPIKKTITKLNELGVKKIYPIRCSGSSFREFLKEKYPDKHGDGYVGLILHFD